MLKKETKIGTRVFVKLRRLPEFKKTIYCAELRLEQLISSYFQSFPQEEQRKLRELRHELVHLCFFQTKGDQYGIAIFSHEDFPQLLFKKIG